MLWRERGGEQWNGDHSAPNRPLWGKRFPWPSPSLQTLALLLVNQAFFFFALPWKTLHFAELHLEWKTASYSHFIFVHFDVFFLFLRSFSGNLERVMHVLKGTHICCALGAGRQHCYWGPNLIFSLFWSSTFNHWLLGGSAFPKKLFESRKKMLLQHVYGIIHVKRGLAHKKKMLPISSCTERRMDSWVRGEVGENHNITVSSQDIPNSQCNFCKMLDRRDVWRWYLQREGESGMGGGEQRADTAG